MDLGERKREWTREGEGGARRGSGDSSTHSPGSCRPQAGLWGRAGLPGCSRFYCTREQLSTGCPSPWRPALPSPFPAHLPWLPLGVIQLHREKPQPLSRPSCCLPGPQDPAPTLCPWWDPDPRLATFPLSPCGPASSHARALGSAFPIHVLLNHLKKMPPAPGRVCREQCGFVEGTVLCIFSAKSLRRSQAQPCKRSLEPGGWGQEAEQAQRALRERPPALCHPLMPTGCGRGWATAQKHR